MCFAGVLVPITRITQQIIPSKSNKYLNKNPIIPRLPLKGRRGPVLAMGDGGTGIECWNVVGGCTTGGEGGTSIGTGMLLWSSLRDR